MQGLAYHPIAVWWRDFIGQGIWADLASSIPMIVVLIIGLLLLPKIVKTAFKLVAIVFMLVAIVVAIAVFNPFGAADVVLGFLN